MFDYFYTGKRGLIGMLSVKGIHMIVFMLTFFVCFQASARGISLAQLNDPNNSIDYMMVIIAIKKPYDGIAMDVMTSKLKPNTKLSNLDKEDLEREDPKIVDYLKKKWPDKFLQLESSFVPVAKNIGSAMVNKDDLPVLISDERIDVFKNHFHRPSLASSVPVIFPNQLSSIYQGAGQEVVLIDTGVSSTHSFLSGKINHSREACFSNDDNSGALPGGESLCPSGFGQLIGSGAGEACSVSLNGCEHGTHMAGVISGSGAFTGVAPESMIIPIQVFSKSTSELVCGIGLAPCIGALTSDIIRAIDYVSQLPVGRIAAVNISLETTDVFEGFCDNEQPQAYLDALALLKQNRIPVISASGNASEVNKISAPACISSTISVAATDDLDVPWPLNNRSSALDFFASGVSVETSTLPANNFSVEGGTSIAAAHLSGAWAVLRSKNTLSSVDTISDLLVANGAIVTQGLVSKPRINLTATLNALPLPPPPSDEQCFPIKAENSNISIICL